MRGAGGQGPDGDAIRYAAAPHRLGPHPGAAREARCPASTGQARLPAGCTRYDTVNRCFTPSPVPYPTGTHLTSFSLALSDFGLVVLDSGQLGFHNSTGAPSPDLTRPPSSTDDKGPWTLPVGQWCQVSLCVSSEAKSLTLYADGALIATAPFTPHLAKLTQNLNKVELISIFGQLGNMLSWLSLVRTAAYSLDQSAHSLTMCLALAVSVCRWAAGGR